MWNENTSYRYFSSNSSYKNTRKTNHQSLNKKLPTKKIYFEEVCDSLNCIETPPFTFAWGCSLLIKAPSSSDFIMIECKCFSHLQTWSV